MREEHEKDYLEEESGGYTFPVFSMWIVYVLLLIVIAQIPTLWMRIILHGVYLFIVLLFIQMAFSRNALKKARQIDETMTSGAWQFNTLLFFVAIPLLVWGGGMAMRGWRF